MKILVVHEQDGILKGIQSVLTKGDAYIRYFKSGLDALMASRLDKYDLVICGTNLPVITGFELARALRINSMNPQVPIVFVADEINERTRHLGQALGVLGMLIPGEVNQLPKLMEQALVQVKAGFESSPPHR